tara:strand:+ start:1346 stop:1546 length:201 start_codon:yes stop_codon:yes gene_type:complete
MRDFILSLGRDIPSDQMESIEAIGDKRKIMKYCLRFTKVAAKVEPKAAPKPAPKAAPKPVKADEEE